jgi:hypothetical protein
MEVNSLPVFLNYGEEGKVDQGCEALQDFFISWTLRCAMETYRKDNVLVNSYSKNILLALLHGYNNSESEYCFQNMDSDTIQVISVKTRRQFKGIDLIAEIEIENKGLTEHYLLSIENKWYGNLGANQLKHYSEAIKQIPRPTESRLVQVLLYCDEEIHGKDKTIMQRCEESGYKCTDVEKLKKLTGMYGTGLTMNYMFDEYWFRT